MQGIPKDRDHGGVPVICSKCNATFESDSDYMLHYDSEHGGSDE